jgi:hypothetical protein
MGVALALQLTSADAQEETQQSRFTFLPGKLLLQPLTAYYQEPRVGLRKEMGNSRMKLDIGSSLDILEYSFSADSSKMLRLGADLFTYALTTNSEGFRLQVDAVDGFFGGHIVFQAGEERSRLSVRFRYLHLSAPDGLTTDRRAHFPKISPT